MNTFTKNYSTFHSLLNWVQQFAFKNPYDYPNTSPSFLFKCMLVHYTHGLLLYATRIHHGERGHEYERDKAECIKHAVIIITIILLACHYEQCKLSAIMSLAVCLHKSALQAQGKR
jgi:hypothetical protein